MSLFDADTGELIKLDVAAAERRAERIRLRLDAIADNFTAVMPMIREAIEKRDDIALGYRSISEYVADRFGGALHNLPVGMRREAVGELTEAGMSTRAIAPVVGVDNATVHRDLNRGVAPATPEPASEVEPRFNGAPAPKPAPPKPITGIDGKNYPKSSAPRRPPLKPDAERSGSELLRSVERIQRVMDDDRFPANREQVAAALRGPLSHAIKALSGLLDGLTTDPQEGR